MIGVEDAVGYTNLEQFLERVAVECEAALQQNETVDIFKVN